MTSNFPFCQLAVLDPRRLPLNFPRPAADGPLADTFMQPGNLPKWSPKRPGRQTSLSRVTAPRQAKRANRTLCRAKIDNTDSSWQVSDARRGIFDVTGQISCSMADGWRIRQRETRRIALFATCLTTGTIKLPELGSITGGQHEFHRAECAVLAGYVNEAGSCLSEPGYEAPPPNQAPRSVGSSMWIRSSMSCDNSTTSGIPIVRNRATSSW
jgi:hypothetical protein